MTTICRSVDLTVPPLVGCCLWNIVSCIVMMSSWVLCTRVFSTSNLVSNAVYVDLKYDDVFVLWLIVVCDGELCCLCLVLLLRFVWVHEWCISSQVCIVAVVMYMCAFKMNPVCVVCVVI